LRHLVLLCLIAAIGGGRAWASPSATDGAGSTPSPNINLPVEGVITNPDWVKTPNGADFADDYPAIARALGLGGHATLHCAVAADGSLENCEVSSEAPKGMGFGAAAIEMSTDFLMRPQTIDGRPVSGGEINIPIHFQPAPDDAPTAPAPAEPAKTPTPATLALAHRLALAAHWDADATAAIQTYESQLTQQMQQRGLSNEETIAVNSISTAGDDWIRAQLQRREEGLAAIFSDDELTKLIDFFSSPTGQMWFSHVTELEKIERTDVNANRAALMRQARARFCQQVTCYQPARPAAAPTPPAAPTK
jgi:TonB family protein